MTDIARMLVMVGTVALLAGCSNLIPGSLGGGFAGGGRGSDQVEDMAALVNPSPRSAIRRSPACGWKRRL